VRSSTFREATPLPGQTGANAKLLRKLIEQKVRLVKAELELFSSKLLPPLLEARAEAVDRMASAMAKSSDSLRAAQLKALVGKVDDLFAAAAQQMGDEMLAGLPPLMKAQGDGLLDAIAAVLPGLPDDVFTAFDPDAIENLATRFADHFSTWSSKTWQPAVAEKAAIAIQNSVTLGEDVSEAAARLSTATGIGIEKARTAAQTTIHANAAQVRQDWLEENADVFDSKMAVVTLDDRTCPKCGGLDGETWAIDDPSAPRFPIHPKCRCVMVPQVASWEDIGLDGSLLPPGTRASMDGEVPDTMTYQQWLAAQATAEGEEWVRSFLTPSRYARWRRGAEMRFGGELHLWRLRADRAAVRRQEKKRLAS
jgi:SPP1 gp7 family putative phage head morphogenesis protein